LKVRTHHRKEVETLSIDHANGLPYLAECRGWSWPSGTRSFEYSDVRERITRQRGNSNRADIQWLKRRSRLDPQGDGAWEKSKHGSDYESKKRKKKVFVWG